MNEVKDGLCIIDAMSGIDCATPQIGQFTDNFDRVKFLLGKDFSDYTMMIITDVGGHVEVVNTDGDNLIKETVDGETYLLWNIGINITAQSGVIVYQIAAYKRDGDAIEETWYSKEGRLVVTESISTNEYSTSLIGSYPNLLTRLLIESDSLKNDITDIRQTKVDVKDGFGLSENSFSDEEKEKLSAIEEGAEVNVPSDWQEDDENSDSYIKNKPLLSSVALSGSYNDLLDKPMVDISYNGESYNAQSGKAVKEAIANLVNSSPEALDTLYELSKALGNDPNFAKTVATEMGKKVDKEEGKTLSSNDYTDADKEKLLSVQSGAEKNVISDWAEVDSNSDRYIKNKPVFSSVALSGSYNDLTDKPYIPSIKGLASEGYVDTGLEKKADKSTVDDAITDFENLKETKADKSALDDAVADIENLKENKADKTTKINGKPISDDVNLTASDVGALPVDHVVEGFGIPFEVTGTNLVTIQKVHPKEHDVEVEIASKNLIPFPYSQTSKTLNGVTFTVNDDGSILVNGTAEKTTQFNICSNGLIFTKAGNYHYSGCPSGGSTKTYALYVSKINSNGWVAERYDTGNGNTWLYEKGYTYSFSIYIFKDTVCENLLFKPMLEKGSVATPYTPYVNAESVNVCGKNLLNIDEGLPKESSPSYYTSLSKNTDGSYTIIKRPDIGARSSDEIPVNIPDGVQITISVDIKEATGELLNMILCDENKSILHEVLFYPDTKKQIITTKGNVKYVRLLLPFSSTSGQYVTFENAQLEYGDVVTEFEVYKGGGTYPVTDGKAIVKSVSPTMNITTPTSGVNIEAKGYQDGLAVIDELKQAIISLGGNI